MSCLYKHTSEWVTMFWWDGDSQKFTYFEANPMGIMIHGMILQGGTRNCEWWVRSELMDAASLINIIWSICSLKTDILACKQGELCRYKPLFGATWFWAVSTYHNRHNMRISKRKRWRFTLDSDAKNVTNRECIPNQQWIAGVSSTRQTQ